VVGTGSSVTRVKVGDYAALTVRRGCGHCASCRMGRSDMCQTGKYRERGIRGLDGYQTEFVVDKEEYTVRVPPELEAVGVLMEPLSIVEKAIDEAVRLQVVRCPDAATSPDWILARPCLVAGLGPVGLLAVMVLRLRGGEVHGLDVVDSASAPPAWLEGIGGHYVDGRQGRGGPGRRANWRDGFDSRRERDCQVGVQSSGCLGPERGLWARRHSRRRCTAPDTWCRVSSPARTG
jgi:glucose 1-dehydrogenase